MKTMKGMMFKEGTLYKRQHDDSYGPLQFNDASFDYFGVHSFFRDGRYLHMVSQLLRGATA